MSADPDRAHERIAELERRVAMLRGIIRADAEEFRCLARNFAEDGMHEESEKAAMYADAAAAALRPMTTEE